jgi:CheY-like chemotaxis protein
MTDRDTALAASLKERSVLVVEDEVMISFLIQDLLEELGCQTVWQAPSVSEALNVLAQHKPDLAVLDVNVAGELVYPVAERLSDAGVPFLFTTGYGRVGMPERWNQRPVLQKPYDANNLSAVLMSMLSAPAN